MNPELLKLLPKDVLTHILGYARPIHPTAKIIKDMEESWLCPYPNINREEDIEEAENNGWYFNVDFFDAYDMFYDGIVVNINERLYRGKIFPVYKRLKNPNKKIS